MSELTLLGKSKEGTKYPTKPEEAILETFEAPKGEYEVELQTEEFTSLCPITAQPDYARISVKYIPNKKCIESKALKLYLFSFRGVGAFAEAITNRILNDLVKATAPQWMEVKGYFAKRGGIGINVTATYEKGSYGYTENTTVPF